MSASAKRIKENEWKLIYYIKPDDLLLLKRYLVKLIDVRINNRWASYI